VADVEVGSRGIEARFDHQGLFLLMAFLESSLKIVLRMQIDHAPRDDRKLLFRRWNPYGTHAA
jgi:hypothetical protein